MLIESSIKCPILFKAKLTLRFLSIIEMLEKERIKLGVDKE